MAEGLETLIKGAIGIGTSAEDRRRAELQATRLKSAQRAQEKNLQKYAKKSAKYGKNAEKKSVAAYEQGRADVQSQQNSPLVQQQKAFLEQLRARSTGQAPSLAEAQMKSAQDRNLAQQVAAITAQRGGNNAATQRQLLNSQAAQGQQLAGQAAQARLQEINEAQGLYGNAMQGARSQDIQLAQMLQQQAAQRQAEQSGLSRDMYGNQIKIGTGALEGRAQSVANQSNILDAQRAKQIGAWTNTAVGAAEVGSDVAKMMMGVPPTPSTKQTPIADSTSLNSELKNSSGQYAFDVDPSLIPKKGGGSDERLKKDVSSADKDIKEFLDKLSSKKFEYKDSSYPTATEGKRVGIMAQDLEKTDMGKMMVKKDENGMRVISPDAGGFGAILAAQASLNKRLEELEKKKSKK